MRHSIARILLLALIAFQPLTGQERLYHLAISGSFTTSSKLFRYPDDPDESFRSQFVPLDNVFGVGIDFRRSLEPINIQVGIGVEYITRRESFNDPVPGNDGYDAIPIELSGYFFIPLGDERIQLYMGGGAGTYIGSRRYQYAGAIAPTVERKPGYGIHIVSGVQCAIAPTVSFRSELKFRDVQFETANKFTQASTYYNGSTIVLDKAPFSSRVNIDGMTLTLGLVYHF